MVPCIPCFLDFKVIKQEDQISTSNSNCACETKSHYQSSLPNLHYLACVFQLNISGTGALRINMCPPNGAKQRRLRCLIWHQIFYTRWPFWRKVHLCLPGIKPATFHLLLGRCTLWSFCHPVSKNQLQLTAGLSHQSTVQVYIIITYMIIIFDILVHNTLILIGGGGFPHCHTSSLTDLWLLVKQGIVLASSLSLAKPFPQCSWMMGAQLLHKS